MRLAPLHAIETTGLLTIKLFGSVGHFLLLFRNVLILSLTPPFRRRLILQQMEFIGNQSFKIIIISGFFIGAVFSLQIGTIFTIFGAEGLIGAVNAKALSRELSPLMTGFLISGRAGAAITAEIATMKVNEQIDAMEAMAVNPISYLVVPRFVASTVMIPILVGIFNFAGQLGAIIVGIFIFDVDLAVFFEKFKNMVDLSDILRGLEKALIFGIIIALLACQFGLKASGGAKGVGEATTNCVVTTLLTLLAVDFFITYIQITW